MSASSCGFKVIKEDHKGNNKQGKHIKIDNETKDHPTNGKRFHLSWSFG